MHWADRCMATLQPIDQLIVCMIGIYWGHCFGPWCTSSTYHVLSSQSTLTHACCRKRTTTVEIGVSTLSPLTSKNYPPQHATLCHLNSSKMDLFKIIQVPGHGGATPARFNVYNEFS